MTFAPVWTAFRVVLYPDQLATSEGMFAGTVGHLGMVCHLIRPGLRK